MKIQLDKKKTLISDAYCYYITESTITKEGKNAGKPIERRVSGYTATLEQCFDSYIDKKIKSSEAAEIKELANEITELKKEVKDFLKGLERR